MPRPFVPRTPKWARNTGTVSLLRAFPLRRAARILRDGGLVAYPTEAVYGIGCDPDDPTALYRLLALKNRPAHKGFILIADDFSRLRPYVELNTVADLAQVLGTWPGPVTWLLPASARTGPLITGGHSKVAVRVTAHPVAASLCRHFDGPLVSTSANIAGNSPARTPLRVRCQFGSYLDYVLCGTTGGMPAPSEIRDADSGRVLRPSPSDR